VLFRDGRELIKQGKLAEGCDKLEASEKLDSSIGTLLNLGDCREKLGMLASSWAAFRKAEATAKRSRDDKRQAEANRRAAALEPRLSNLVIEVKQPVTGLVVKRDGQIVDPAAWNTTVPVDPRKLVIVAEAPGYTPWKIDVVIDNRSRRRVVTVPQLARETVRVEPPPPPAPVPTPAVVERTVEVPVRRTIYRSRTWSTTREFAAAFALVGAGAVGVGAYFGVRARDLQDRSDVRCPTTTCDDAEGLRLNDDARLSSRNANILFAVGGGAIATGVVMWLSGKPDDEIVVAPAFGERHAGVALRGRF
jgi:hypothetical protein